MKLRAELCQNVNEKGAETEQVKAEHFEKFLYKMKSLDLDEFIGNIGDGTSSLTIYVTEGKVSERLGGCKNQSVNGFKIKKVI